MTQRLTSKMFVSEYQAMPTLLLTLAMMLAGQSLVASEVVFTEPNRLRVSTDRSRAAVTVSRQVTSAVDGPTSTTSGGGGSAQQSNATTGTPPADKMTGTIDIAFAGVRELDSMSQVARSVTAKSHYAIQLANHRELVR